MQWVFEHIQIIIAVAAAIAYALNRGKGEAEEQPLPPGEAEDAERARQIREEIRRKIAERREGGAPAPVPERTQSAGEAPPLLRRSEVPPIDTFGGPRTSAQTEQRPATPPPVPATSPHAMTAVLERQNQLAEQMRQLERNREMQKRRAAEVAAAAEPAPAAAFAAGGPLVRDLRGAKNLRRAMVLREVLGAPVALR